MRRYRFHDAAGHSPPILTTSMGYLELTGNAKCDVTVVQINYQTPGVHPGEMTNASAAVLIPGGPDCPGPFPLVAFSRATKLEKAYTNADPNDAGGLLLMTIFASQGYAVVATDYQKMIRRLLDEYSAHQ